MKFNEFMEADWRDDLSESFKNWDYYADFNAHLGHDFSEMIAEAQRRWQDAARDPALLKRMLYPDYSSGFMPRRDKKGNIKNPTAGVQLVSPGENNPKTGKGYAGKVRNPHTGKMRKIKNAVMHLLPAGFSGCNTCPAHTPECAEACLDVAGSPIFMGVKTAGRARRTFFFAHHKNAALKKLAAEVERHTKEADSFNLNFGIRLNGTSDVAWESPRYWFEYKRKHDPGKRHPNSAPMDCPAGDVKKSIFCHFPDVQFYDYSKVFSRVLNFVQGKGPPNYHLVYSYNEKTEMDDMYKLLDAGGTVAMVFAFAEKNYDPDKMAKTQAIRRANKATKLGINPDSVEDDEPDEADDRYSDRELAKDAGPYKLPKIWHAENGKRYRIVSGDIHDLRFLDERGVIVGLSAKGDAKYAQSNGSKQTFVVQPTDPHIRYEEENRPWVMSATKSHPRRSTALARRRNEEIANMKELAGKLKGKDKSQLLSMINKIESGEEDFMGPGGQRRRSNALYAAVHDKIEAMRKSFKDQQEIDLAKKIEREIQDKERLGEKLASSEKRTYIPWSDEEKDSYRQQKRKEYRSDYEGFPAWNHDFPHWQASDPSKAPNLIQLKPPSELSRHVARHKDDFDSRYADDLSPTQMPVATPLPARKKTKVAESNNPYLEPLLDLI